MTRTTELVYRPGPGAGSQATLTLHVRPARACAFSGCPEPKDRQVGPWPLCRTHADRVEGRP